MGGRTWCFNLASDEPDTPVEEPLSDTLQATSCWFSMRLIWWCVGNELCGRNVRCHGLMVSPCWEQSCNNILLKWRWRGVIQRSNPLICLQRTTRPVARLFHTTGSNEQQPWNISSFTKVTRLGLVTQRDVLLFIQSTLDRNELGVILEKPPEW